MTRLLLCCLTFGAAAPVPGQVITTMTSPSVFAPDQPCATIAARLMNENAPAVPAEKTPLSYFGVGLGAVNDAGDQPRVEEATVVDGKVVILQDNDLAVGPVLEAHALLFTLKHLWAVQQGEKIFVTDSKPCTGAVEFPMIATGPFAMIRAGDDEVIKSIGVGWMLGFRMRQSDASLNIGVAFTRDPNVRTLAAGFEEGATLPAGETQIRYRITAQDGVALVLSFGW